MLEVNTCLSSHIELRILVDIRMSNGVHISLKNSSNENCHSMMELLRGKRTWTQIPRRPVFIVKDFLTVP